MPERLLRAVAGTQQMTLDFDPGLVEKFGHCLDVARAMSRLASVLPELEALLRAAKGNG